MGRSTGLFKAALYMDRLGENVQSEQTWPIVSRACYLYSKLFALDIFATSIFPANIFNFFFFFCNLGLLIGKDPGGGKD